MVKAKAVLWWLALLFFSAVSYANEVAHSKDPQKPSLILLKEYQSNLAVKGWLMSEKLDGMRAYWDGEQLLTRNGHLIHAPEWFINDFPPFELDGELWIARDQFQKVVSIVRKKQPDAGWRMVTYQIFEAPNQSGGLLKRLSVLQRYVDEIPVSHLKLIKQTVIKDPAEIQVALQKVLALKGEGLVLRRGVREYHTGRSRDAVKVKWKQDAECVVVGYTEGKGKYVGQVGALKCQLMVNHFPALKTAAERIIKIGSGLSDALRKTPPLLGTVVTFQYIGLTQKGLPRFPSFLRVRY